MDDLQNLIRIETVEEIAKAIKVKILNDLDIDFDFDVHEFERAGVEDTFRISTLKIGLMASMISELEVHIICSISQDLRSMIRYDFRYGHTQGGRNGYTVNYNYLPSGKLLK